jgi:hypothetical protein
MWRFILSVVVLFAITLSDYDLLNNWRKVESEDNFKCKNKLGDGSVMCYFTDRILDVENFNVIKMMPDGNFSVQEIRETFIVKIHSLNMPKNLPGMSHRKVSVKILS